MEEYDERLHVPRGWWLIALLGAALLGVVLLPLGPVPLLIGLAAGAAAGGMALSAYGSARIRVVGGTLIAHRARIPVTALGEARALDAAEALAWRTHRADARAHLLLRGYVPTAVRVEVTDPADPTPYLYLSTRRPHRLVAALRQAPAAEGAARPVTGHAEGSGHAAAAADSRKPADAGSQGDSRDIGR